MCITLDVNKISNVKMLKYDLITFIYNGKKYYFKTCESFYIHSELIMMEFASLYGIEHVHYDLANFHGKLGLLSEDSGYKTLSEFGNNYGYNFDKRNNNINHIVEFYSKLGINSQDIEDSLYSIFIFDMLIGNCDRHSENIFANEFGIGPIFDNSSAPFLDFFINGMYELLLSSKNDWGDDLRVCFFKEAPEEYIKLFFDKLALFNDDNIEYVFNKFKVDYSGFYDEYILDKIKRNLIMNIKLINRKLNDCIDNKSQKVKKY